MRAAIILTLAAMLLGSCKKDRLHWKQVTRMETHTTANLNRIAFLDEKTAVIAGGDKFGQATALVSYDSGYTFQCHGIADANAGIYGLSALSSGIIMGSGFGGELVISTDTGRTWRKRDASEYRYLIDLAITTSSGGLVASTITTDSGAIWRLDTSGQMTRLLTLPTSLARLHMLDERNGYACGLGIVLKTTDGGATWDRLEIGGDNFLSLYCAGTADVYVCGYNGSIFHSADAGESWKRLRNGNDVFIPHYKLADLLFVNPDDGYAVGENGLVIYTDDAGAHWSELERFTKKHLRAIALCPDKTLLVCGEDGEVWRISR